MPPREPLPTPTAVTKARVAKGLTQADLATKVGMPRPKLSIIERGYVPLTHERKKIAKALDSTERDLWPQLYEGTPEPIDPHEPRRALHKSLMDAGERATR